MAVLALVLAAAGPLPAPDDPVRPRGAGALFSPADVPLLEERSRDAWQRPDAVVAALGLQPGESVADIGAGSGYMMAHLSRAVGPAGCVYAQDLQPGMVRLLRERAGRYPNVEVIRGRVADPSLPRASIDAALLLTSYHEMMAPVALLSALRTAMRPGGRLAIVDFNDFALSAATPRVPYSDRVPAETVIREAARAGWRLTERRDGFPYQYCLVFAVDSA